MLPATENYNHTSSLATKSWLKILGYGLLALASLLFSILCLLSIVAAPVSLLSLGFFASTMTNVVINVDYFYRQDLSRGIESLYYFEGLIGSFIWPIFHIYLSYNLQILYLFIHDIN